MLGGRVGTKGGFTLGFASKEHGVQYNLELLDLKSGFNIGIELKDWFFKLRNVFPSAETDEI
jgi:hypothetical protein